MVDAPAEVVREVARADTTPELAKVLWQPSIDCGGTRADRRVVDG
jgi:hypothetical protein